MPSDKLTEAEAAELERLEKAATPGRWSVYPGERPGIDGDDGKFSVVLYGDSHDAEGFVRQEDADLTAAARTTLPRLLSERRATAAALNQAREALEKSTTEWARLALAFNEDDGRKHAARDLSAQCRAALARIEEASDG